MHVRVHVSLSLSTAARVLQNTHPQCGSSVVCTCACFDERTGPIGAYVKPPGCQLTPHLQSQVQALCQRAGVEKRAACVLVEVWARQHIAVGSVGGGEGKIGWGGKIGWER